MEKKKNEHGFTSEDWEAMDEQLKEGYEQSALYESEHADELSKLKETVTTPEIFEQVEQLFIDFESKFPLDQLIAIETEEEAISSELREGAKESYKVIHQFLKENLSGSGISSQQSSEIESRRKRISMAIGMINSGRVRHN